MNKEETILLNIIRQSQFGPSEPISFAEVDMALLYNEALNHAVLGLVAPEIPSECSNSKWHETVFRFKAAYIRYCNAQDELKTILDNAGIPFVILKGNASAIYYKDPSLRSMGDIDFIVPRVYFDKANEILASADYIYDHETDRHVSYKKGGFSYELHNRFSHDINIENYIIDGINSLTHVNVDGYSFPMLPKFANGLVLLDHLRAHLKSAVGLRHVIDWMMYVYRNLDDYYWNTEFKSVVQSKNMDLFAITVTRMCQIYLGLPETITWCKDADVNLCSQLIENILISGNFGRKNGYGNSVEKVRTHIYREGYFHWLQRRGEHNWKAYHKCHMLKPFCWIYQAFRYAKQGFKTGRNRKQIKSDLDRSKERYELLKKLGIE